MEFKHIPIMVDECITNLDIKPDGIYVDGTIGGGGHSMKILEKLNNNRKLIGIDRDKTALEVCKNKFKDFSNVELIYGNHDDIKQLLENIDIFSVDGILLDLGVSSYQLDEKKRGFSYLGDNSLDMRMDQMQSFNAKDVVNTYSKEELEKIFRDYGEEKFAKNIAKNIDIKRKQKQITTTKELVEIIDSSIPAKFKKQGHPAKKVFQAIRIEVNNELKPLEKTIFDCIDLLNDGGTLAVLTFHSLEDRIVKNVMKQMQGVCTCPKDIPYCICNYKSYGKMLKPLSAKKQELEQNTRAKSAKLRIFKKQR